MGLDCSHDAFHGAYTAFNRFRQQVAKAIGGSYPPHAKKSLNPNRFYCPEGFQKTNPGLFAFLAHSDCDGEIDPLTCRLIAVEMETILPQLDAAGLGGGHIEYQGGYGKVARLFIAGCLAAAEANEPLVFG